jgi:hypothetical protein
MFEIGRLYKRSEAGKRSRSGERQRAGDRTEAVVRAFPRVTATGGVRF